MGLSFRKALNSDFDAVITLSKETIDKSYRYWLGDRIVNQYLATDSLDRHIKNNIENVWLASDDNEIIGFAICIENIIEFMLVGYNYQRKGYGSQILEFCENMLLQKYETIALESFEKNTNANAFYNSNEWKMVNKYIDTKSLSTKLIFSKKKSEGILN